MRGISSTPYFGPEQVGPARQPAAAAGAWRGWPAGMPRRPAGWTAFVANSQYVAGRIRRYYNRGSTVVYPPVDTTFYRPGDRAGSAVDRSFLVVSALVPYKRIDVAIEACRRVGCPLEIVGRGPEEARLARAWPDRTSSSSGWRSDEEIRELYRQADGRRCCPATRTSAWCRSRRRPAARRSSRSATAGRCETVVDGVTGVLVDDDSARGVRRRRSTGVAATADSIATAIRAHAERFSRERFMTGFQARRRRRDRRTRGRAMMRRYNRLLVALLRRHATPCSAWSAFALAYLLRFHWLDRLIPVTKGIPPFAQYVNAAAVHRRPRAARVPGPGRLSPAPRALARRRFLRRLRRQHPRRRLRASSARCTSSTYYVPDALKDLGVYEVSQLGLGALPRPQRRASRTRRASSCARRSSGAGGPASASSAC